MTEKSKSQEKADQFDAVFVCGHRMGIRDAISECFLAKEAPADDGWSQDAVDAVCAIKERLHAKLNETE